MQNLLFLSFKSLVSNVTRWLLALLAIAFGVTGIVSSLTINNALTASLNDTARALLGNADAELVSMNERGFSGDALTAISGLPQLSAVAPRLSKLTYFEVGDGTTRGFLNLTGIDPTLDPQLHPQALAAGVPLATGASGGLLVSQLWAQSAKLNVGDKIRLITSQGFTEFTITGLLTGALELVSADHPAAYVNLTDMTQYFVLGAKAGEVGVLYKPGEAANAPAAIAAAVHEPYILRDPGAIEQSLASNQNDFRWLLSLFGVVAIVAGGVEILNTLSILSSRRTRELSLMRSAGGTRAQVTTLLVLEALMAGAVGSVIGIILGWAFAGVLSGLVQAGRGISVSVGFDFGAALTGFFAGLLVALLAALVPAWNVARRAPLDALRGLNAAAQTNRSYVLPAIVSVALLIVFGFVVWALLGSGPGPAPQLLLAGFALVLFLGLLLILLAFVPLLIALAGVILRRSGSGLAWLAQRNLRWRSGRTAATASALTIAITLLTTLLVLASGANTAGNRTVEALFAAPYVVVAPVAQPPDFLPVIQQGSGASAISSLRKVTLSWDSKFVDAVALDPAFYGSAPNTLPLTRGDRATALRALQAGDAVLVPFDYASRNSLDIGSTMNIWTPNGGPKPFKVVGLLTRSFPATDPAGALVLSTKTLQADFGVDTFTQLLVRPGGADFAAKLQDVAETYGMQAQSTAELADNINRSITQTLLLFGALTGTAALVGALSVINAMSLNVLERAPVIGLLRAAGMSTQQVAVSILIEATLLGLLAGILGVALGSGIGWLLFTAGRISESATFSIPWLVFLLIPAAALLAMLAAIYPARQAANTSAMQAVRTSNT